MEDSLERDPLVVFVTTPVGELAEVIARALVEEGLAACVNILGGIRSIYHWEGAVQDDQEQLLVIKTTADRFGALEQRVKELHSYDVAEVVALPIVKGSAEYLGWVTRMCHRSSARG